MNQVNASFKYLLVIDSQVSNWQSLTAGVGSDTAVLIVDSSSDGFTQISNYLTNLAASTPDFTPLQSLQIISHGSAGSLLLGSSTLTTGNLKHYTSQLASIGSRLTATGDILLYGCNVAAGQSGLDFINLFSTLTNADVAASNDVTGSAALGGNWQLEANTGSIEAALALNKKTLNNYTDILDINTQADVKILVSGSSTSSSTGTSDSALVRYNTNGSLDKTFGVFITDTTPPTSTITDNFSGNANRTTTSIAYNLAFSEAVTGLDTTDFTLTNGTVSSITGSGSSWAVNVTPALGVSTGSIGLTLKAGAVSDSAGNHNARVTNNIQAIDTIAPVAPKLITNAAFNVLIDPQLTLQTSLGKVVLELNLEQAPVTVANILAYANDSFYDNTLFHRVIAGFMVQGGGVFHGLYPKDSDLQPDCVGV